MAYMYFISASQFLHGRMGVIMGLPSSWSGRGLRMLVGVRIGVLVFLGGWLCSPLAISFVINMHGSISFLFSYIFGIHKQVRDLGGDRANSSFSPLEIQGSSRSCNRFFSIFTTVTLAIVIGENIPSLVRRYQNQNRAADQRHLSFGQLIMKGRAGRHCNLQQRQQMGMMEIGRNLAPSTTMNH